MELIKIKPLSIVKRSWSCYKKLTRFPYYDRPTKVEITLTEAKKFHVLISEGPKNYYSFQLCGVLEIFNYDLNKITDLKITEGILTFNTEYGTYQVGDLIETETLF